MKNAAEPTITQEFLLPKHITTINEIWKKHAPETCMVDVNILLDRILSMMNHANPFRNHFVKERANHMLKPLPFIINKVFSEITIDCSCGRSAHATTVSLLHTLASYSWDAKLVLSFAAYAMCNVQVFGNYLTISPMDEYMDLLVKLPYSSKQVPESLVDEVGEIRLKTLRVTIILIELGEQSRYLGHDTSPALRRAIDCVPMVVYWTVRSVVALISQILCLAMGQDFEKLDMEPLGLVRLKDKIEERVTHLEQQINLWQNERTGKLDSENKRKLQVDVTLEELFKKPDQSDNQEILQALICSNNGIPPLVYYSTEREVFSQVHIDILKGKKVLLLITELTADPNNLHNYELATLKQIYEEKLKDPKRKESQFEIVWVPVPGSSEPDPNFNFDKLKSVMPWYAVAQPLAMDLKAINHIKRVWQFGNCPLLVVLDGQGKVVHLNALHMVMLWGKLALPFTADREEALWEKETWSLDFLVDGIDPLILQWVKEKKFICLYGGKDIELIRQFTTEVKNVAKAEAINLEMVYVGASNDRKKVRDIIKAICKENLSPCWRNLDSINQFWTRLQRMWVSRQKHARPLNSDPKGLGLAKLLTLDGRDEGWALFTTGSTQMTIASGDVALKCLQSYNAWKEDSQRNGFLKVLKEQIREVAPKRFSVEIAISEATVGNAAITHPTASKIVIQNKFVYRCIDHHNPQLRYGKVGMK